MHEGHPRSDILVRGGLLDPSTQVRILSNFRHIDHDIDWPISPVGPIA